MSLNVSKSSCKHSYDKCLSPGASNVSHDESELSIRTNDVNINADSYVNTPSPSSIASISTVDRPCKHRLSNLKSDFHPQMSSKRRYRYDRLFHYTNSLNRQYRRTHHVEQMLANQIQSGQPIIRIPRLTRDDISTICVNNDATQQNISSEISEENENNNESPTTTTNNTQSPTTTTTTNNNELPTTTNNIEPLNEEKNDTENLSITLQTTSQTDTEINNQQEQQPRSISNKYCSECNHEFSHRSAYLRHMRRIHKRKYLSKSNKNNLLEADSTHNEPFAFTTDQPDNEIENESYQVLVNQWDIGEGRLRPRRVLKAKNEPINKVKCDICGKFFRTEYVKKHQRRAHCILHSSSSNDLLNNKKSTTTTELIDDFHVTMDESSTTNTNPPSAITIAEMDIDDLPIQFRKESNKPIVITVTCLERYQLDIIEEFLQKFSSRAYQTPSVDSRTTHLIINDEQNFLRSPLSMKLIEGIAHHCFCVSYRWIVDCIKYDRIIEENSYEIEGDDTDLHPHGGPKRSRLIEKRHSLFENVCFMIKCTENNDIRMTNDRLQDLITTCGGQIINCVTQELLDQYDIVVLCDKLYVSERRHNYDECRLLGIHFVSSDWVLESILEYRQKPFSSYEETPL